MVIGGSYQWLSRRVRAADARQPSLAQLRAFAAVAEHLHFRDAAAAIGMSQPALSGAVSALEEALGVQLLERTTRKVLLSPGGRAAGGPGPGRPRRRRRAAGGGRGGTGALHRGAAARGDPAPSPRICCRPCCGSSTRRYPDLDLQVHEEQTVLAAGGPDRRPPRPAAARRAPRACPGSPNCPLFDEDFVLVAPRGALARRPRDIPREALAELDLLLLDEGHCLRDQALDICREAGRDRRAPP